MTGTAPSLSPAWRQALTEFAERLEQLGTASPATRRGCIGRVQTLALAHPEVSPWSLNAEQLEAWLQQQDWTVSTRTVNLKALRRFYAWAAKAGHVQRSPLSPAGPLRARPTVAPGTTSSTWRQALDDFADHLERHGTGKAQTHASYVVRVQTVAYGLLDTSPWTLTTEQLTAWLAGQNWSAATRKASLVALRRFYAWALRAGRVERSPLVGIPDGAPKRPGPLMRRPASPWAEPIAAYLASLQAAGQRPASINLRRNYLTSLSHHFADPWAVTYADLVAYLSRPDWSPDTRKALRSTLRLFYRWAVLDDRILKDPALQLASVRVPRTLPRPAPAEVVMEALHTAPHRVRLAVELGAYAGLRIGEVARLQVIDYLGDRLLVRGKGGHERIVPVHPSLALTLTAELERRQAEGITSPWFFPSPHGTHLTPYYLTRLVSDALPGNWTHHTLRHRFATQAYATQRDLRAVQELLGHVRPETTARYAAVPENALTAAVAGVGLT